MVIRTTPSFGSQSIDGYSSESGRRLWGEGNLGGEQEGRPTCCLKARVEGLLGVQAADLEYLDACPSVPTLDKGAWDLLEASSAQLFGSASEHTAAPA